MKKSAIKRRILWLSLLGFALAIALMTFLIWQGYKEAYAFKLKENTVDFLGLELYHIFPEGAKYTGNSNSMGIKDRIKLNVDWLI